MATSAHAYLRTTEELHRTTIALGGRVAAATVAVYAIWAVAASDPSQIINGLGPLALAIACFTMLHKRWYHAEVVLIAAALSTILSFKLFGQDSASSPAMTGVVVIVAVGALFMGERWKWTYVWIATLGLLGTGVFWDGLTLDAIWTGVAGSLSALVAMTLFVKIRESAAALDRRYRVLVEEVPTPLLEEDWSHIRTWVETRRAEGVTDIEAYMDNHPDEIEDLTMGIKVRGINPAIFKMFSPKDKCDFEATILRAGLTPFVRNEITDLWNRNKSRPSEYRLTRADGEPFWARIETVDIDAGLIDNVDRLIVATDVTELRDAQDGLADQIRTKDEFIAAISHELRTPLTSILGFAAVINDQCVDMSPEDAELMEILLQQAQDMAHIVEDLLVAARTEIGDIPVDNVDLDLGAVVERAMKDSEEAFEVVISSQPIVVADAVRVGQIVRNLVSNATRYGGTMRRLQVRSNGGYGIVEVRDNGDPIPPDARERIFEPYARAQTRPGLAASVGLGLSISRQLARLMNGEVTHRRDDDENVFVLTLPLAAVTANNSPRS